jgi:hypothetical protein
MTEYCSTGIWKVNDRNARTRGEENERYFVPCL